MTEDFDAFFQNVTAEQAPAMTTAMIEMFGQGENCCGCLHCKTLKAIPTNITTVDHDRASLTCTRAQVEAPWRQTCSDQGSSIQEERAPVTSKQEITVNAIVPRDAVTDAMLQNSPQAPGAAWVRVDWARGLPH